MIFCEFLADLLMLAHAFYSIFVFVGLVLILAGMILGWRWTRQRWFRVLHLSATLFVVARAWIGIPCPFSAAEDSLRLDAGESCPLAESVHDIMHQLAFRGNDPRQFARSATLFGALVAAAFVLNRSAPSRTKRHPRETSDPARVQPGGFF